jgi:hypothetical protein
MGLLEDMLKLTKLKAKHAKEDIHKCVKEELKKAEEREKNKKHKE